MSEEFISTCQFRGDGIYCIDGFLFYSKTNERVQVEGEPVTCPACEGEGILITAAGHRFLKFYERFLRKKVEARVREIINEQFS